MVFIVIHPHGRADKELENTRGNQTWGVSGRRKADGSSGSHKVLTLELLLAARGVSKQRPNGRDTDGWRRHLFGRDTHLDSRRLCNRRLSAPCTRAGLASFPGREGHGSLLHPFASLRHVRSCKGGGAQVPQSQRFVGETTPEL